MRLKTRIIIFISAIVVLSYGLTFYRTASFQEELVVAQAARQARMLHYQIKLTRKWIADHDGIFLIKGPGVEANPFLPQGEIVDIEGTHLVKRNPAMVTRELSLYAAREGFCRYGVTSLKPINPDNAPDEFEKISLQSFNEGEGEGEAMTIEKTTEGTMLRYIAPLYVEDSCLQCHAEQGYEVGDIRGGLSVAVPVDWAYASIAENNRMLLGIALGTIVLVACCLFLLVDFLVVRRVQRLAQEMDSYPEKTVAEEMPDEEMGDEGGELAVKFRELCRRLERAKYDLVKTQEQVFQSEKMAALGRLVAGVGHEINNPLAGMLNCVKSMGQSPDDQELNRRYLPLLEKGLNRIKNTMRQLLDFGRQEALSPGHVMVDKVIEECFELLGYGLKGVDLRFNPGVGRPVLMDGEALAQVVMNIGLNAIQAMADGGVLEVITRYRDDGLVNIVFQDSGPGIDPDLCLRIFDPFFTTKDVGEGTGLGLSVTYSLVERMGGHISAENSEEGGAVFVIDVPDGYHSEKMAS